MDFLHLITFEMIMTSSIVIVQLIMEFNKNNRVAREILPYHRILFCGATIMFLAAIPFPYESIAGCVASYILLSKCFFLEWKFPTDPNSPIVKKYQELLKKRREEKGMTLPESPLFLKLCEIGNKIFPWIMVALSVVVVIKVIVLVL